jgi:hypothetical protein
MTLPRIKEELIVGKQQGFWQQFRYLVCTGFLYKSQLVCVPLQRESPSGPERYVRSAASDGRPRLHLLPVKMLDIMETAEFYLSTSSTAWLGDSASGRLTGPVANYAFQAELSSTEDTVMGIIACNPTINFRDRTVTSLQRAVHRTIVWRAERVYDTHERLLRMKTSKKMDTLNISVVITSTTTQDLTQPMSKEEIVQIGVELHLPPAHSTCTIRSPGDDGLDYGLTFPLAYRGRSDRAEYTLQNGQVVAAGMKFVTQGNGSNVFILRVAVLPRSLHPG